MKMEHAIKAPKDGVIKQVLHQESATVDRKALLVTNKKSGAIYSDEIISKNAYLLYNTDYTWFDPFNHYIIYQCLWKFFFEKKIEKSQKKF